MAVGQAARAAQDIYLLSPATGDLIVVRTDDAESRDALLMTCLKVKQDLAAEGIRPCFVIGGMDLHFEDIPAQALIEQGYLQRSVVRDWIFKHVPLGKQSSIVTMFEKEFGSYGA